MQSRLVPAAAFAAALAALAPAAGAEAGGEPLAARASWAPSLSAGFGASYDAAGFALELRRGHFAGFLGLGSDVFVAPPDSGPKGRAQGSLALGVRWFSG